VDHHGWLLTEVAYRRQHAIRRGGVERSGDDCPESGVRDKGLDLVLVGRVGYRDRP
jgi:hypothetical protein